MRLNRIRINLIKIKKEVSKIESQYMKEKQEIDEKHRNKVLEQYEVWIQKKHGNSI